MQHDVPLSFLYAWNHILGQTLHITKAETQTRGIDHYKKSELSTKGTRGNKMPHQVSLRPALHGLFVILLCCLSQHGTNVHTFFYDVKAVFVNFLYYWTGINNFEVHE